MTLIVGLGNPGDKHNNNRHNIGFKVIDAILKNLEATSISKASFQGLLFKHKQTLFLKPQTYMNLSGQSVKSVVDYFDIEKIIVIHDDLDLPFGTIRFKYAGGHGGHNGLRSIDKCCGNEYFRVRFGIGKPEDKTQVSNYVLHDFPLTQKNELSKLIAHCAKASEALIDESLNEVSCKWSLKTQLKQDES